MIRAGEGTRVRGAVTARLLDRIHGQALAELYEVTFSTRAPRAGPHPAGVVESLILTAGRLRAGRAEHPVELSAGDFVRFPGDVPYLYQAIGAPARGILMMSHPWPARAWPSPAMAAEPRPLTESAPCSASAG